MSTEAMNASIRISALTTALLSGRGIGNSSALLTANSDARVVGHRDQNVARDSTDIFRVREGTSPTRQQAKNSPKIGPNKCQST
jgi:hypothetical protein